MWGFGLKIFKQVRARTKWRNIDFNTNFCLYEGLEANFEKASSQTTNTFGVPYDYGSVMHYSANAFSRNGQPTIVALVSRIVVWSLLNSQYSFPTFFYAFLILYISYVFYQKHTVNTHYSHQINFKIVEWDNVMDSVRTTFKSWSKCIAHESFSLANF